MNKFFMEFTTVGSDKILLDMAQVATIRHMVGPDGQAGSRIEYGVDRVIEVTDTYQSIMQRMAEASQASRQAVHSAITVPRFAGR